MSTLQTTTSTTRPSAQAGDTYFETDTKNIIVYDGTNWRAYVSDGSPLEASSYSLKLDGADDYVELGDVSFLSSAVAFSISLWVKAPTVTGSAETLFRSGTGTGNSITMYQSGSSILFYLGLGSVSNISGITWSGMLLNNSWRHIAAVYGSSSLSLYIDGSLATTSAYNANPVPSATASTAGDDFTIGSYQGGASNELDGYMDDFAIFDSALTGSEVSNIKNNAIYPTAKLRHLYKFENNFNDSIGNLDGTGYNQAQASTDTARP